MTFENHIAEIGLSAISKSDVRLGIITSLIGSREFLLRRNDLRKERDRITREVQRLDATSENVASDIIKTETQRHSLNVTSINIAIAVLLVSIFTGYLMNNPLYTIIIGAVGIAALLIIFGVLTGNLQKDHNALTKKLNDLSDERMAATNARFQIYDELAALANDPYYISAYFKSAIGKNCESLDKTEEQLKVVNWCIARYFNDPKMNDVSLEYYISAYNDIRSNDKFRDEFMSTHLSDTDLLRY